MKVPLSWLSDYVDLPANTNDLVYRLTMSGTEIEDVVETGKAWEDVIIGFVVELEKPKGSKTLQVATIDIGDRNLVAVTAAPNIAAGQRVPLVRIGGTVPRGPEGTPLVLQPRQMLGITGEAMVLSARELAISDEHTGILVLPEDAPTGSRLDSFMSETTLDTKVTANRPDQMSILGVAREVSATFRVGLRQPATSEPASLEREGTASASVEVQAAELCPRYTALRIEGIRIGPSPRWLNKRLESTGTRSINNVVDVTNFVMLELGQPLHAFDWSTVTDGRVVVRRARPEETLVTLDGVSRALYEDTLVIADAERPVGIAGIMGGEGSEVSPETTAILLESANFDRVNIRRSSRRLGLRTEASARYERGIPPELTEIALARCLHLLGQVMEGPLTVYEMVDVTANAPDTPRIDLRPDDTRRILGIDVTPEDAASSLERLGFETDVVNEIVQAKPPYWRRDVEGRADLCEEIARMIGYDRIPETLPAQEIAPAAPLPDLTTENIIREALIGAGVSEAWTHVLTSPESFERLFPDTGDNDHDWNHVICNPEGVQRHSAIAKTLRLLNAPTVERSVARLSMIPSLLDVVSRNLKYSRDRVAFFEIGRTFFPRLDDLPYERRTLTMAIAGERDPRSWAGRIEPYDFFDLKGMVEAAFKPLDILDSQASGAMSTASWKVIPPENDRTLCLHPGRRGILTIADEPAGFLGELHPAVAAAFDIELPHRAYVAEIDLDVVNSHTSATRVFAPIPKVPGVRRDIALVFPDRVSASDIVSIVKPAAADLLRDVRIVDVYHGENLGAERKSIALSLEFQSASETLTQEQVTDIQNEIVARLEKELGGALRS